MKGRRSKDNAPTTDDLVREARRLERVRHLRLVSSTQEQRLTPVPERNPDPKEAA